MVDNLIPYKKLATFSLEGKGTGIAIQTKKASEAVMITDIIISKEREGRLLIKARDRESSDTFLFVDDKGTFTYSFPSGITFWNDANIEVQNNSEGLILVTIGYLHVDGKHKSVWRQ